MEICEIDKFDDETGRISGFMSDSAKRFIKTAHNIRCDFSDVRLSTMLFFLGEKREILAAQHISEIDFDMLDAEAVSVKAKSHGSSEIYITHFPEDMGEGDTVVEGTRIPYPKALKAAERDAHDMIGFCSFAKALRNKNLTTVDVALLSGFWSSYYSMHVSCELFPGLHQGMSKYVFDITGLQCQLKTPEDKLQLFDYLRDRTNSMDNYDGGLPKAYAVFVSHYDYCSCFAISVNNFKQIPGVLEGCKLIPEDAIRTAKMYSDSRRDEKGSMIMVVDKQENDLSPNESEIAFAQEAHFLTQKYGIPLKEIVLLGKYHPALRQYDTLVI